MRKISIPFLVLMMATTIVIGSAVSNSEAHTTPQQNSVLAYELLEFDFDVPSDITNPYDPAEADIFVTFVGPDGSTTRVPAFFMEEFEDNCITSICDVEQLRSTDVQEWRVRFTPTIVGDWAYRISGTINSAAFNGGDGTFSVIANADARGFIRVADNDRYFEFDDGTPYFPIGENLGWSWEDGGGIYKYIEWLDELAAVGANYARLNVDVPWFSGIEWTSPPGQYGAQGQRAAYRLDRIFEAAEERGIYLHVSLIWHQAFRQYPGLPVNVPTSPPRPNISADFDNHPYNSIQGGNLSGAGDILFNTLAQSWLQRRMRYMMARYAYSPAVFSWEIIDAFDRVAAFVAERDVEWLNPLHNTINEFDPNNHLISVGTRAYVPTIQNSNVADFAQITLYQRRPIEPTEDQVQLTFSSLAAVIANSDQPVLINEFSLNPWFEPAADDPSGVHIRNTIWAGIINGAAGSPMSYWWDTYIDTQNLYHILAPVSGFATGIQWNQLDLQPTEPSLIVNEDTPYEPLLIDDFNQQFLSASPDSMVYRLTADGANPPTELMSSYLYGQRFNTTNARAEVFVVNTPVNTTMSVRVRGVSPSASARLEITIDGTIALSIDLSPGTDATTFTIPLAAGAHEVTLNNTGDDWLQLESIEIADYRAPLRVFAIADKDVGTALVWIHHREYSWESIAGEQFITPQQATLVLTDMPVGEYRVEFWDTATGNVLGEDYILVEDRAVPMTIELLPIDSQLALRVLRIAGPVQ